jgi:copper chaperone CopZ
MKKYIVKMENNEITQRLGQERWIRWILVIVAFLGLSYGTFQFGSKSALAASEIVSPVGESVIIPMEGLSCSACVARVKKTLKSIKGVSEVKVSLEKHEAEILYDPEKTSPEKLAKAIDALGYRSGMPKAKEKSQ